MDLEQLKAFVAVVNAGSISRAARQLHISQPALSLRLRSLEQSLGVTLVIRNYEGVSPTAHGDLVADTGRRILELCESLNMAIKNTGHIQELAIGATPTLGGFLVPHVLPKIRHMFPQLRLHMTVGTVADIAHQIEDGRLAVGFMEDVYESPDLHADEIGTDMLRLVAAPNTPIDDLDEARVFAMPHVLCVPGCGMRMVLERFLAGRGRGTSDLQVVAELNSLEAVKTMVEADGAVAWLSARVVGREIHAGSLRIGSVQGVQIPFRYIALRRAGRAVSPEAGRLVTLVRERLRMHRRRAAAVIGAD